MKHTSRQGYLLEARKVSKSFGDFTANDGIDFAIRPGEILALLGENGAGKSTFVKMIYGLLRPDSGGFFWQSEPLSLSSPQQAREMGIGMVFQHFSLFEMLTVAENIELALQGAHDRSRLAELIIEKSTAYGIPLDPDSLVADLSVSQRQRVEILRCLLQNPKLLIMDEPTSVLTPQEANQLFDVIEQLAGSGCAVLFISHKLDEVKRLTKRAVILRGGRKVADVDSKKQSAGELAALMVGDEVAHIKRQSAPKQSLPRLSITSLSRPAEGPFNVALKQIDMIVNQGEILGIAGIAGNGQTELMDALTGEWTDRNAGLSIMLHRDDQQDIELGRAGPAERRKAGVGFVPEERNGHAAIGEFSLSENALLTTHHIRQASRYDLVNDSFCHQFSEQVTSNFDVRLPAKNPQASQLSGGNLQKFVVGREIMKSPKLLVVSQPTWGVDIGAAIFIRKAMLQLAEAGGAVIMISQDLEEIFSISHRIAVLNDGRLSQIYDAASLTAQKVGLLMGGAE